MSSLLTHPSQKTIADYARMVERALDGLLPAPELPPARIHEAMRYAALSRGKRLRPALVLAVGECFGAKPERLMPCACAVELVHSFSLIQDDLPCMDNDDLRRGKPTLHVAYGQATALLAADALYTLAFETLAGADELRAELPELVLALTRGVGTGGMIGGQFMDLEAEGKPPCLDLVKDIHWKKTSSLVAACCELGALAAGASSKDREVLRRYGQCLGLAFQVADDILDEEATLEQAGKRTRKDRARRKQTYPAAVGLEQSHAICDALVEEAIRTARDLDRQGALEFLARFICQGAAAEPAALQNGRGNGLRG